MQCLNQKIIIRLLSSCYSRIFQAYFALCNTLEMKLSMTLTNELFSYKFINLGLATAVQLGNAACILEAHSWEAARSDALWISRNTSRRHIAGQMTILKGSEFTGARNPH